MRISRMATTLNSLFPIILKLIPQIILFTIRHSNFFSSWIISLLLLSNYPSSFNNCLHARYSDIHTLVMNFNCEFTSYIRHLKLSKLKVNQVNKGIIWKQLERMARLFWSVSKKQGSLKREIFLDYWCIENINISMSFSLNNGHPCTLLKTYLGSGHYGTTRSRFTNPLLRPLHTYFIKKKTRQPLRTTSFQILYRQSRKCISK